MVTSALVEYLKERENLRRMVIVLLLAIPPTLAGGYAYTRTDVVKVCGL